MDIFEALLWLTLNIYHEARSEDRLGQLAVAHVTLNRTKTRKLSIREVVTQPFQFSWTHQLDSYWPTEPKALVNAFKISIQAIQSKDFTQGATYYHRTDVTPKWAPNFEFLSQFGVHKFYRPYKIKLITCTKTKRRTKWRLHVKPVIILDHIAHAIN